MTNVFRTLINVGSVLLIVTGSHSLARAKANRLTDLSAHVPRGDLGNPTRLAQAAAPAPVAPAPVPPTVFTREELERLLAPYALYPDALLAQLLPASAYPVEIVQASRWLAENKAAVGKG